MSHHYISFKDVCYRYPDGFEALKNVSFRINHGEKVALLGLNGAGKSTLLLHTNGLILPTSGEVNVGDVPVTRKTLNIIRRTVGMVFQNSDDQLFMPTVEEDVAFGPVNMELPPEEIERRVVMALDAVGCGALRKKSPDHLSGGQKKSVAIATVLSMQPDIMVLDEPTTGLDILARKQVMDIISSFSHTMLIATHDLDMVKSICGRAILMKGGEVAADGEAKEICEIFIKENFL